VQPVPGLQGYRRFHKGLYGRPTLWKLLAGAGKRCTVFDATYTHPEEGFSGVQVFDWGTWARYWKPMSTPPGMLRRLERECGAYPLGLEALQVGLAPLDPDEIGKRLVEAAAAKTDAILWMMDQEPWDLLLALYCETHPAAHYCWPPGAAGNGGETGGEFRHLRALYEEIDCGIGRILERAGRDATVFVISGEGVGPNRAGWHLLPEVLRRLGFFAAPPPPEQGAGGGAPKKGVVGRLKNLVRPETRKAIAGRLPHGLRDAINRRLDSAGVDWSRTRAFCLPTDLEGCIRLNLKDREPKGMVAPGAEAERVSRELADALLELSNPRTGRPAVREVVLTDSLFPGERRPYLPDLIVVWSDEAEITELHSPRIGTVGAPSPDGRTGTHTPPGFAVTRGLSVARGETREGGSVFDLVPTVLGEFGVPPPPGLDGKGWSDRRGG
ncbi:MAG: hypothetical protein ABIH26_11120, partial [Candidatus Eisenbacteria bacterium]